MPWACDGNTITVWRGMHMRSTRGCARAHGGCATDVPRMCDGRMVRIRMRHGCATDVLRMRCGNATDVSNTCYVRRMCYVNARWVRPSPHFCSTRIPGRAHAMTMRCVCHGHAMGMPAGQTMDHGIAMGMLWACPVHAINAYPIRMPPILLYTTGHAVGNNCGRPLDLPWVCE